MKKLFVLFSVMIAFQTAFSQKYLTKTGIVSFRSKTPIETIEATNKAVAMMLDVSDNKLDIVVLIKSFVFEKQLMQEHFNENYMESDKFPKATFKGNIMNPSTINWNKDGEYKVAVEGKLTIHGVTKDIVEKGTVHIRDSRVTLSSEFSVLLNDYNISTPAVVRDKIAKEVHIKLNGTLDALK
jgi:YceI-like domain.